MHSLNLIYLALLLRNVVRRSLQNIVCVKMLYVNLRKCAIVVIFSFVFVLIFAVLFVQCFLPYYDK